VSHQRNEHIRNRKEDKSMNTFFQRKPGRRANGRMTKRLQMCTIALIAVLAGPLQSHAESAKPVTPSEGATISRDGMKAALKQPLNDLNLLQAEIPPALQEARSAPYARPTEAACDALISEVRKLDAELGQDLDQETSEASFKQKAAGKALDLVRDAASGVIPYRGAVRFVSGAQKHDRLVAEARRGGEVRRAYLKGVGESMGCQYPGSPLRAQITASASPSDSAE
jgi:hypothetical protein